MIRVFLVDDHAVLREGLRVLLSTQTDVEVVGEATTGAEALARLAQTAADVVVLDLCLPDLDGTAVTRQLRERFSDVGVLVLSMTTNLGKIGEVLRAGAGGYVLKSAGMAEVVQGIRTVAAGLPFLCAEVGLQALEQVWRAPAPAAMQETPEALACRPLTGREREVLQLIAEGLSNQEISDRLFTSKRTVETHRQNLIAKMQSRNTAELIKQAMRQGLIG